MQFRDYYEIMGLKRNASADEIKRAYRKLARQYHPDVSDSPDAEARFKELGEAYEVLKDPEKRAAYDQLGQNWRNGQDFSPPPGWNQGFEFHDDNIDPHETAGFSEFFSSLFGRRFNGGRPTARSGDSGMHMHGSDARAAIEITLEDSLNGAQRSVSLQHVALDDAGQPQVRTRTLDVRIPRGIQPGQQIRLAGQGSPGVGRGQAGDLYLEVRIRPHPQFTVDGKDIYLDLPIAPWEAALGATVQAPTPTGAVDLAIPAGSQQGRKLRLRGRGLPAKQPGDFYVVLNIVLPPADTDASRAAYRELQRQTRFDPRTSPQTPNPSGQPR